MGSLKGGVPRDNQHLLFLSMRHRASRDAPPGTPVSCALARRPGERVDGLAGRVHAGAANWPWPCAAPRHHTVGQAGRRQLRAPTRPGHLNTGALCCPLGGAVACVVQVVGGFDLLAQNDECVELLPKVRHPSGSKGGGRPAWRHAAASSHLCAQTRAGVCVELYIWWSHLWQADDAHVPTCVAPQPRARSWAWRWCRRQSRCTPAPSSRTRTAPTSSSACLKTTGARSVGWGRPARDTSAPPLPPLPRRASPSASDALSTAPLWERAASCFAALPHAELSRRVPHGRTHACHASRGVGWCRYELVCKPTQYVQLWSRGVWPRVDMAPLARVLAAVEAPGALPGGVAWVADPYTDRSAWLRGGEQGRGRRAECVRLTLAQGRACGPRSVSGPLLISHPGCRGRPVSARGPSRHKALQTAWLCAHTTRRPHPQAAGPGRLRVRRAGPRHRGGAAAAAAALQPAARGHAGRGAELPRVRAPGARFVVSSRRLIREVA